MLAGVFTVWAVGAYGLLFAWACRVPPGSPSRELALRVVLSIAWPLVLLALLFAVLDEEPAS